MSKKHVFPGIHFISSATVAGTTLTVSAVPTAASIAPLSAYAGSTITVTGANFISGFACCAPPKWASYMEIAT